jgi:hypothetical protein
MVSNSFLFFHFIFFTLIFNTMMSVNDFMNSQMTAIQGIIKGMPDKQFDSHAFIRKFAERFQPEYVSLLTQYDTEPFETVHQQIGRFLVTHQAQLGITAQGKVCSANIFGNCSENELWSK